MKTGLTTENCMHIRVGSRHSADTIASELVLSGYVVKYNVVYKKYYLYEIDHYYIEFYKPNEKVTVEDKTE